MPINLNSSNVEVNNPAFTGFLKNLQANILKHHGRKYAWHLLLEFVEGKEQEVKQWIREKLAKETTGYITDAFKQLKDAEARKVNKDFDGGPVTCFFLSAVGYEKLGFTWSNDFSFFKSMKERGPQFLSDPEVSEWEKPFRSTIHAMLLVADKDDKSIEKIVTAIAKETAGIIKISEHVQKGVMLYNQQGEPIEHFGYVDGISQPLFLANQQQPGNQVWNDAAPLSTVLIQDPFSDNESFGSFLVFRKLEQDVKKFHQLRDGLPATLFTGTEAKGNIELAGAFVVGRFEDGAPVTVHPIRQNTAAKENNFNYDEDKGMKCPLHAHIRMTNPRKQNFNGTFTRIVRRGMPYDEAGRNNDLSKHPEKGVGLLFLSYQANIARQFETIQTWANTGVIPVTGVRRGIDGIVGQGKNLIKQDWPTFWESENIVEGNLFEDVVHMKGGEYFFTPSISFLRKLN